MFSFPTESDLAESYQNQRSDWLKGAERPDCLIAGGDPSALVAGIFLEREEVETTLVVESDTPGGKFAWRQGPVPVVEPAHRILEALDFDEELTAPLWLQRSRLLSFLLNLYFTAGGNLLSGVTVEKILGSGPDFEIEILIERDPQVVTAADGIVVGEFLEPEVFVEADRDPAELMVLNTERTSCGLVQSGYQAVSDYSRGQELKLVNGLLLSGRKAAEVVLKSNSG